VAQLNRGRVSDPAQAALSGSHRKAPGSAGGYLLQSNDWRERIDNMLQQSINGMPIPAPEYSWWRR
jgi:hypothetical protein